MKPLPLVLKATALSLAVFVFLWGLETSFRLNFLLLSMEKQIESGKVDDFSLQVDDYNNFISNFPVSFWALLTGYEKI